MIVKHHGHYISYLVLLLDQMDQCAPTFGDCVVDVPGCTDANALNYNADANVDDGSCVLPEPCPTVNFDFVNTGVNMTLFAPNGAALVVL